MMGLGKERDWWRQLVMQRETRIQELEAHVAKLTEQIVQLHREGFSPRPQESVLPTTASIPDEILMAIEARGQSPQVVTRLRRYAQSQLEQGVDPGPIAAAIWDGTSSEES